MEMALVRFISDVQLAKTNGQFSGLLFHHVAACDPADHYLLEMLSSLGFQNAAAALLSLFFLLSSSSWFGLLTFGETSSYPLLLSVYAHFLCVSSGVALRASFTLHAWRGGSATCIFRSDLTSKFRLMYPTASETLPFGIPPHQTQHRICPPLPPSQSP